MQNAQRNYAYILLCGLILKAIVVVPCNVEDYRKRVAAVLE